MTRILIVEDEEDLRENIAYLLQEEGFIVETVGNGIEAIDSAIINPPDLILCDIMMPQMNGQELLLELQKDPVTATIPFIFLSALTDSRAGMNLGADDYITKPCNIETLLAAIHSRLRKSQHQKMLTASQCNKVRNQMRQQLPDDFNNPLNIVICSIKLLIEEMYPDTSFDELKKKAKIEKPERLVYLLDALNAATQLYARLLTSFRLIDRNK